MLLDCYGPPSVVVNSEGDILYVNGRTGKYLEPSSGKVNNNVFAMAREGLRDDLALPSTTRRHDRTTVTTSGIKVKSNGGSTTDQPHRQAAARAADCLGDHAGGVRGSRSRSSAARTGRTQSRTPEPSELEDELHHARERLQATHGGNAGHARGTPFRE